MKGRERMISVLLVDDEPLVRITMKAVIPWDEYGAMLTQRLRTGNNVLIYLRTRRSI